ncbi:MAG: PP2C family protein-serine/threonine phosphatase [Thermoanaerobaculia bacterium]|nr:PP2C family protein-serine/threonine phosphatase [Thermoanaerobaculia bacterium]
MKKIRSDSAVGREIERIASPPSAVEVHALSIPAGSFTGDLYIVRERADGTWFALGDVAGKGLDAAVFMQMVHEELDRRLEAEDLTVTCLVSCIHDVLTEELPRNRFLSLVAGHLATDGRLKLVNAGHTQPLLARRDGTIERIDSTGPVAGILPGARWCSRDSRLEAGDILVLYSDGVTEAFDREGAELGTGGLIEIVRLVSGRSPREIVEGIRAGIEAHRSGLPSHDDLTILALAKI